MATLTSEGIADLVATTLRNLGEDHWTDLTSNLQDHVAANELINDNKMKLGGGSGIQFNLQVGSNGSARAVGLAEVDTLQVTDQMKQANVPWRNVTCNMSIIEQLVTQNTGSPIKIVDYVKEQKIAAQADWIKKFEEFFWGTPASSADEKTPYGVQYWIVSAGATSTFGFNGLNPTGFSAGAANVDSTAYPRWANGNVQYANVTKTDLNAKMRECATKCNFKPVVQGTPTYDRAGMSNGYYMPYSVLQGLESLAEAGNANNGSDIARYDGATMFRRAPLTYVPFLDSDTSNRVYGIDWRSFMVEYYEWMVQTGPLRAASQHRVLNTFFDSSLNFVCKDRRRQFVCTL